jgi:hypothetical protein
MIDIVAFEVDGCRRDGWDLGEDGSIDKFTD